MHGLSQRLEVVKHDLRDQAEYVQHLLDQFDVAYDSCCTLQVTIAELRLLSERIHGVMDSLPRPKPQKLAAGRKRSG